MTSKRIVEIQGVCGTEYIDVDEFAAWWKHASLTFTFRGVTPKASTVDLRYQQAGLVLVKRDQHGACKRMVLTPRGEDLLATIDHMPKPELVEEPKCSACGGEGRVPIFMGPNTWECEPCGGTGRILPEPDSKRVNVRARLMDAIRRISVPVAGWDEYPGSQAAHVDSPHCGLVAGASGMYALPSRPFDFLLANGEPETLASLGFKPEAMHNPCGEIALSARYEVSSKPAQVVSRGWDESPGYLFNAESGRTDCTQPGPLSNVDRYFDTGRYLRIDADGRLVFAFGKFAGYRVGSSPEHDAYIDWMADVLGSGMHGSVVVYACRLACTGRTADEIREMIDDV